MSPANSHPIRLLLVDDHLLLRVGLRTLFEASPDFQVVGEADTLAQGIALSQALQPAVVLLDLRLPDGHGVEGCRTIRSICPDTKVLFLTSYVDDEALFSTVLAGAQGYLLKEVGQETLRDAVRRVAAGGAYLDPLLAERARARISAITEPSPSAPTLSPQEHRILVHVVEGLTNKEIASAMDLAEKTVRNYLTSAFSKLQVTRRTEAATRYQQRYIAPLCAQGAGMPSSNALPTAKDNIPTQVFPADRR